MGPDTKNLVPKNLIPGNETAKVGLNIQIIGLCPEDGAFPGQAFK
jgi:hypothetical protein